MNKYTKSKTSILINAWISLSLFMHAIVVGIRVVNHVYRREMNKRIKPTTNERRNNYDVSGTGVSQASGE